MNTEYEATRLEDCREIAATKWPEKPDVAGWATVQARDAHKRLDTLFAEPSS